MLASWTLFALGVDVDDEGRDVLLYEVDCCREGDNFGESKHTPLFIAGHLLVQARFLSAFEPSC